MKLTKVSFWWLYPNVMAIFVQNFSSSYLLHKFCLIVLFYAIIIYSSITLCLPLFAFISCIWDFTYENTCAISEVHPFKISFNKVLLVNISTGCIASLFVVVAWKYFYFASFLRMVLLWMQFWEENLFASARSIHSIFWHPLFFEKSVINLTAFLL